MFDSIRASLKYKPSLYATFDSRGSFISNEIAQIKSVKLGLTFNKQFTIALGYNWLNTNFETDLREGVKGKLTMQYITPYIEYSFLEHKKIEVTIPVYLGFGRSFYRDEQNIKYRENFILTYEPAMTATYRFLKYFGVGAGVGYRLMLVGNNKINERFNSPVYLFKAKIFFGRLYNDLLKK